MPKSTIAVERPSSTRVNQVDVMKGLAILAVITIHGFSTDGIPGAWPVLWLWQAVPVFVVIMGLNLAGSMHREGAESWAGAYTRPYFRSRLTRLGVPFLWAFLASASVALLGATTSPAYHLNVGLFTLVGQMPASGPGNYYLTVLFSFVLLGPALYLAMNRVPVFVVVGAFIVSAAFDAWGGSADFALAHPYVWTGSIVRFLPQLVVGMWLAKGWGLRSARNLWIPLGGIIGLTFMVANQLTGWAAPFIRPESITSNYLVACYSGTLTMCGLAWLPAAPSAATRWVSQIGRDSYHIFLVQMVWFPLLGLLQPDGAQPIILLCLSLVACVVLGHRFSLATTRRSSAQAMAA